MAKLPTKANSSMPAIKKALNTGHPLHAMLAEVLEDLGGIDFITDWAEENPSAFMNILMSAVPSMPNTGRTNTHHVHIAMPEGVKQGPLDVVDEQ